MSLLELVPGRLAKREERAFGDPGIAFCHVERIAATIGDADVVFMRNHGVMVTGATIAEAWDDLYYLERAAEVQIRAMSTGRTLCPVAPEIAARVAAQMREADAGSARLHLDSVKRRLSRSDASFAD